MTTTKKALALALVLTMVLAMAVSVGAAQATGTGTITVDKTTIDDVYSIYQVFSLDATSTSAAYDPSGTYFYGLTSNWTSFKDYAGVNAYFTVGGDDLITWQKDSADATGSAFANLAMEYVKVTTPAIVADGTATVSTTGEKLTFSGLKPGYYLVLATYNGGADYRTPCIIKLFDGETKAISAKTVPTGLPTLAKEVQENSTSAWGVVNDAAFGDTVNYKITITTEAAGKDYVLTDVLPNGMALDTASVKVYENGTDDAALVDPANYALTSSATGFTVEFTQAYLNTLSNNDKIYVLYSAKVNADGTNVILGGSGNANSVTLSYSDGSATQSKTASTATYVYQAIVNKVDESDAPLAGAAFQLYKKDTGTDTYTEVEEIATGSTFTFDGLDAGEYKLVETKVPDGYAKAADIIFTITPSYTDKTLDAITCGVGDAAPTNGSVTITVKNIPGTSLPETGGIGTTIFYIIGSVLVVGAVVLMVTKKRMSV